MVYNPIVVGFAWSQAFDFPENFFEDGDQLRAEFRSEVPDRRPVATVQDGLGIDRDGNRVIVSLSAQQTNLLLSHPHIRTNFVIERGGEEIPIGVVITVPVTLLPTRPEA